MTSRHARVAVFGDVTGHPQELWRALRDLGVAGDADGSTTGADWARVALDIPADLHVVQVGDLVHRGPDSLGAITLAGRLLDAGVWTQLVGNHEQLSVDRPVFQWPESIPPEAVDRLREWWHDGRMTPAAMVTSPDTEWLITHAGLTAGFWVHGLGSPHTPAEILTAFAEARADGVLWHPGAMLTGRVDHTAGPIWAEAGREVLASWLDHGPQMPFSQVHGHSSAFLWDHSAWQCSDRVRRACVADPTLRHVTFTRGTQQIVGIDPQHGVDPAPVYAPLIIRDATVLSRA